ncbi:MAG: ThuA domain-containing protein, partial [Bryobacteraceae bacterium]
MRDCFRLIVLLLALCCGLSAQKRLLYVTHAAGFRHGSLEISRQVLDSLGEKSGRLQVTSTEDLSSISAETLQGFDAVLFFTSGELALNDRQKQDLLAFVRSGKGFGGVHSATDTLYSWPEYGEMIGGYFDGHPWVQEVAIDVEDPDHPIVKHLAPSFRILEEIYQFRSFARDRVRVLMTLDTRSVDLKAPGVNRTDEDFALAWTRNYESGRVFYTALGHFDETWQDPRFQSLMLNAMLWLVREAEGDASPRMSQPVFSQVSVPSSPAGNTVSPGTVFMINGEGLTSGSSLQAASVPLPVKLAGTTVRMNGISVPLFSVSPNQILAQAPFDLQNGQTVSVNVISGSTSQSQLVEVRTDAATPGMLAFAGEKRAGGVVSIYATGLGAVTPAISTGAAATAAPLSLTAAQPVILIRGKPAQVLYSG